MVPGAAPALAKAGVGGYVILMYMGCNNYVEKNPPAEAAEVVEQYTTD